MLLYQARTAAVAGDRKPSALERSGGSSATDETATNTDPAPPPGKPGNTARGRMPEMPREQQEATKTPSGRTTGWHGARLPKSLPEPTSSSKDVGHPAPLLTSGQR
jgi:hypothetical protein